jgi:uncharacterized membrane protein
MVEILGFVGLGLIWGCELVFLDDPYGGENERMNTIFKFYSSGWALVHLLALQLLRKVEIPDYYRPFAAAATPLLMVASLFFAIKTIPTRQQTTFEVLPKERGLSSIDRQFPGAADVIIQLSNQPRGVTLEAQGNAYSYTTHVATLAGMPSYLGWKNHVDLLNRKYDESGRREKMTESIYKETSCEEVRRLLKQEGIQYMVYGPLEKQKYGNTLASTYTCLRTVTSSKEYYVYTPE